MIKTEKTDGEESRKRVQLNERERERERESVCVCVCGGGARAVCREGAGSRLLRNVSTHLT